MRIHKAGFGVILVTILIISLVLTILFVTAVHPIVFYGVSLALFLILLFVLRFFRYPNRKITISENQVISPCDGKVVVIEEVAEDEFLKGKRIQVSIFMSVWNVHINWLPVLGTVTKSLHFSGRFMAAWLPKASTENERSVVVIETKNAGKIMVKQIAGAVARRIITYAKDGDSITAGNQLGFIRFGSRVDLLLPLGSDIKVKLNDKVTGGITHLADMPK